jgi:hypothetical protein
VHGERAAQSQFCVAGGRIHCDDERECGDDADTNDTDDSAAGDG